MGTGITYTVGKIGQAATFPNNCNSCIHMQGLKLQTGSWCAWIKVLGEGSGTSQRIISEGRDTGSVGTNIWVNKAGTSLTAHAHKKALTATINLNEWIHIALTFGDGNMKLYKNGQLITSTTYTEDTDYAQSNDKLVLGKMSYSYTNTSNYFPFNGQLNDVRIYDHVLSDKEVEEIAKGLVIHYKLDNNGLGGENLVIGSNTNSTTTNKWIGHSAVGGNTSSIVIDETGTPCVQITRDNVAQSSWDYLSYDNFLRNKIKTNTTYSISFDAKPSVDGNIGFTGFVNGNATNYMTNSTTTIQGNLKANQWNHCQYLCTTINSFSDITISGQVVYFTRSTSLRDTNVTVLFKNIKVEEGNIFTSWTPAKTDPNYPQNNDTIVYDCSGYNNNGTITGTLETITSNIRYNCATQFDNKEYIIHKLPENMYYATYSFWIKASSYTNYGAIYMSYQSPSAGTSPWFAINTESCKVWAYFSNNSPNYTKGSGTMSLNEWHHCVYVWNNGIAQWYVDGEKSGNSTIYTTRTYIQNTINATIGNSYTGTSWNGTPFSGQISDFRIYATALTAEQIKELYHTSVTIDNKGNIYARELVEE